MRGRKASVPYDVIINTILKYKNDIWIDNKISSKNAYIWHIISRELSKYGQIKAISLYMYVTSDRYKIRKILDSKLSKTDLGNKNKNESIQPSDNSLNNYINVHNKRIFMISLTQEDYQSLLFMTVCKNRVQFKIREWNIIAQKICNKTQIQCEINFKRHYLSQTGNYGYIDGKCHCGLVFRGILKNDDNCENCVKIECILTSGSELCGKQKLRSEKAKRLMFSEESEISEYLDPDPILALAILKNTLGKNIIHDIGLDPFFVIYFTSRQIQIYKTLLEHVTLYINANDVGVIRLNRPDGTLSRYIFLYQAVINSVAGQFSVSQFLTEIHTWSIIRFWLVKWCGKDGPYPKEVVTDISRTLLTAVIQEFTNYPTIEQYADACRNTVPACYIRIDIGHFMKTYSNALKSALKHVRNLYLAVVEQVVLCRQIENARTILKALLIISQCELEGTLEGTWTQSDCKIYKQFLKRQIIAKKKIFDEKKLSEEFNSIPEFDEDREITISSNWWFKWGEEINCEIQNSISQKGTRANVYYAPHIATKLLRDIGTIPLWSNICTDKFGYGRIPASSARVESKFNKLKNKLIVNNSLRTDIFVEEHIKYLIEHGSK